MIRDILILTKFRINVLAVLTGYAAIAIHATHLYDPGMVLPCLLAMLFTGGGANALNQIIERGKDARMERTRIKRPLPSGRMSVRTATIIALIQIAAAQVIFLCWFGSWLACTLSLFTIAYYSFFYTCYLKPRHYLNIVVGGVPGAMGPLMAWAAVADEWSWVAFTMAAIIFLWTPPHVWALAIRMREDYARAGVPMLPVVKGVDETTRQIFVYTVILVAGTLLLPFFTKGFGLRPVYTAVAVVGGIVFLVWTWRLWRSRPVMPTMPLFTYTLLYIGSLFLGLVLDAHWAARGGGL